MSTPRVALVGGNCNNSSNDGFRYVNVNNDASNSNWNIGASPVFRYIWLILVFMNPYLLVKMSSSKVA